MNIPNSELEALHRQLTITIREYAKAGGAVICWMQPGEDTDTHDMAVCAGIPHVAEMLHDIQQHLGEGRFKLAQLISSTMETQEPINVTKELDAWGISGEKEEEDHVH